MAALEPDERCGQSDLGDGYLDPAVISSKICRLFVLRIQLSCYQLTLHVRIRCAMDDSTQQQRGPTTRDRTS
ncbi:hypothetical protein IG631_23627 [Alternaria alternata]|nr:hypothetical protein IG631_23627 [Alternaria alternata]